MPAAMATQKLPAPENILKNSFGITVRQAREKLGFTQEVLADKADLNRSYLGEIERGIVMPSLATISKLANALRTDMTTLIARCEEKI
jgi:transcriptional regulator with XRE-family HTH domain